MTVLILILQKNKKWRVCVGLRCLCFVPNAPKRTNGADLWWTTARCRSSARMSSAKSAPNMKKVELKASSVQPERPYRQVEPCETREREGVQSTGQGGARKSVLAVEP